MMAGPPEATVVVARPPSAVMTVAGGAAVELVLKRVSPSPSRPCPSELSQSWVASCISSQAAERAELSSGQLAELKPVQSLSKTLTLAPAPRFQLGLRSSMASCASKQPLLQMELSSGWLMGRAEAGAELVKGASPGPGDSSPSGLTELDGRLRFQAATVANGAEL